MSTHISDYMKVYDRFKKVHLMYELVLDTIVFNAISYNIRFDGFVHVVRHLRRSKVTRLIFFKGTPTRGICEELTVVVIIMRPWPFISPIHLCEGSA
jgi:hypothetical protein